MSFKSSLLRISLSFFLIFAPGLAAQDSGRDGVEPPVQIRWDLTDLYASEADWRSAFAAVQGRIQALPELRGKVSRNAESLARGLQQIADVRKDFYRLAVYANLLHDEDQRIAAGQERLAKVRAMETEFGEAIAWLEPELIELGEKKIRKYLKKEKEALAPFDFYLQDLIRNIPHRLDEKGETVLAAASNLLGSPNKIYELLVNADVPWPEVDLSNGERALLNQAGYVRHRAVVNRADRKMVFDRFWGTWQNYQDSLGAVLATEVHANVFAAKARNYESVLEQQLAQEGLPAAVYETLVAEVNNGLPALHRYFRLRGRILGIDEMRYYDIYSPLVQMETDFGIAESKRITLEVLEPLGEEYMRHLRTALAGDWAHVYPQPGKRSGAYMSGAAYDVHPYVLLNHNDDYNALSTYAHEWGHAVHSLLANAAQPFTKARYSTFVAEIASIINEILLEEYMIANAETKEEKLFYLGQALEAVRGTFYRQTMFAEFELKIHEAVEAGEPLTGARLSEIYGELLRRYHDHAGGTVRIDDLYSMEWAYIPHFYYDFYVFQYSTSMAGAIWFAEKLLAGDEGVRRAFIDALKAGGSDYAYRILLEAGLDMASPEPYRATVRRMNDIMDRIEGLLGDEG